jgi:hypothetical protein
MISLNNLRGFQIYRNLVDGIFSTEYQLFKELESIYSYTSTYFRQYLNNRDSSDIAESPIVFEYLIDDSLLALYKQRSSTIVKDYSSSLYNLVNDADASMEDYANELLTTLSLTTESECNLPYHFNYNLLARVPINNLNKYLGAIKYYIELDSLTAANHNGILKIRVGQQDMYFFVDDDPELRFCEIEIMPKTVSKMFIEAYSTLLSSPDSQPVTVLANVYFDKIMSLAKIDSTTMREFYTLSSSELITSDRST